MEYCATLSGNYEITLPEELCDELGIKSGDKLVVKVATPDMLTLSPFVTDPDRTAAV